MIPNDTPTGRTPQRYPALNFVKLFAHPDASVVNGALGNGSTSTLTRAAAPSGVDHHAIRAVVGTLPPIGPLRQARQLVSSELSPLESAITSGYTGMASRGAAAIKQATDAYANELAAEHGQLTAPYTQAETAAAASQDAFANRVTGAGTSASDELAQRLASIGEPGAVNPVVAGLAGKATAAGNAVYGTGNATLDQLISQKAAAEGYASKLPGVARTAGLQQLGQFEGQVGANESKDLLALEEKAPGLVQSAYTSINSANAKDTSNKIAQERVDAQTAATTLSARKTAIGVLLKQAVVDPKTGAVTMDPAAKQALAASLGVPVSAITGVDAATLARITQDQIANGFKSAQVKQGQQRIAQGQQKINQAGQRIAQAAANASRPNASLSRVYGYQVDANGNPIGGKVTPIAGYKLNAAGDGVVKIATPRSSSSTASGARQVYKQAVAIAQKAVGTQILGKHFGAAFNTAYNQVESYLVGTGMSDTKARQLALKALGAAGYALPGQVDAQP